MCLRKNPITNTTQTTSFGLVKNLFRLAIRFSWKYVVEQFSGSEMIEKPLKKKQTYQKDPMWFPLKIHLVHGNCGSKQKYPDIGFGADPKWYQDKQMSGSKKARRIPWPITSSPHVFTNPESTKFDFFHEICRLLF